MNCGGGGGGGGGAEGVGPANTRGPAKKTIIIFYATKNIAVEILIFGV